MENYICINSQKINLTEEQVAKIKAGLGVATVKLLEIPVGETAKIGDHEMVILEQSGDTTALIRKDLLPGDTTFGKNNNFDGSKVDAWCAKFADEIAGIVGKKNVVLHTVDLTSDDGLKDYGHVKRYASPLTADRYRRYVEILDKFNPKKWWWLATAHSTKRHDNASLVLCVSPSGYFGNFYDYGDIGVRPFCILKSNIFVSK